MEGSTLEYLESFATKMMVNEPAVLYTGFAWEGMDKGAT